MSATDHAVELVTVAARAAADKLATDIVAFDVSEQLAITDAFLLASGNNERQVRAIVDEIEDKLRAVGAQLVLAGTQAETGEGSGMLPFMLAERLGWPLVTGLAEVESVSNGVAQVLQALPRGQRRRLKVRLPMLATVDNAAPKARQPPDWGRFGLRQNKAARWPTEQGQMGELCVHKSGKVSLRINGDLQYDVSATIAPRPRLSLAELACRPSTDPAGVDADVPAGACHHRPRPRHRARPRPGRAQGDGRVGPDGLDGDEGSDQPEVHRRARRDAPGAHE